MCPTVFLYSCLVCCRHDADISADFSQDVKKSALEIKSADFIDVNEEIL